jgi:hypothetical protein
MTERSPKPPEALLRAIAADLKPVKPSPLPARLTLRMTPLAVLVSALVLMAIGIRRDVGILGPFLAWGASTAQFLLAVVLVWIAAREATPAARLPKKIVYSAAFAASLAVVAISLLTFWTAPESKPLPVSPWIPGLLCGIGATLFGGLLVLLFTLVYRKSLAIRPTFAGALYGAGAGLAINSSWRLACPGSTPSHALGSHGTAIVATALLGALIGRTLGRRNQSPNKQSPPK